MPHGNKSKSTQRGNYLALYAIGLGHTFTHWYPATFYVVLPFLGRELGLSYTQIALIFTIRQLVKTFSSIPAGALVDILGKRSLLMVLALLWVGLPYFFMGLFANYAVIIISMAMIGVGNTLYNPSAITELTHRFSDRRGWAIGIHSTAANVGDAIAPLVMGLLMSTLLTWRQVLMVNFVPGLVVAVILWRIFASSDFTCNSKAETAANRFNAGEGLGLKRYLTGIKELLKNKSLLLLALTSAMRSVTQNSLLIFLPLYYANILGMSPALIGVYTAALQVAGMVASPLAGLVSDRHGRRSVVTTGLTMTSIAIVLLIALRIEWLFVVFLAILGFFLFSLRTVLFAWTTEATPAEYSGTTISILMGVQSSFTTISPIIGGLIADHWGMMYTFYFVAATILLANIIVYFIPDEQPRVKTSTAVRG